MRKCQAPRGTLPSGAGGLPSGAPGFQRDPTPPVYQQPPSNSYGGFAPAQSYQAAPSSYQAGSSFSGGPTYAQGPSYGQGSPAYGAPSLQRGFVDGPQLAQSYGYQSGPQYLFFMRSNSVNLSTNPMI